MKMESRLTTSPLHEDCTVLPFDETFVSSDLKESQGLHNLQDSHPLHHALHFFFHFFWRYSMIVVLVPKFKGKKSENSVTLITRSN